MTGLMPTSVTGLVVWLVVLTVAACAVGVLAVWWVWPEPPPPPPEVESLTPPRLLDTDEIDTDEVDAAWRDSLPEVARDVYPSVTCPRCRRTSYNPHDIAAGYCGACHDWTSPPTAAPPPRRPAPPPHRAGLPRYVKDPKDPR